MVLYCGIRFVYIKIFVDILGYVRTYDRRSSGPFGWDNEKLDALT